MLKDETFRCAAARALGKLGPAAKTAVPALTKLLSDKNEDIRKAASAALKKIQEEK
jgi:HEAT repeat protein